MILYLFLLALLPSLGVLFMIYFSDRFEKEPLSLIYACLAGGVLATIPIMALVKIVPAFFQIQLPALWQTAALSSFVHAAFIEESLKFAVFFFLILRSRNFNEPFDAVVYYVAVGVGFAIIENLQYITAGSYQALNYGHQTGLYTPFVQTSLIWGVMRSLPGHAVFGALSGVLAARFKFGSGKGQQRWLWLAWGVALMVHGVFNFLLSVFPGNSVVAGASWLFMAAGAAAFLAIPLLLESPFNRPRRVSLTLSKAIRQSRIQARANRHFFVLYTLLFSVTVIGTYYINQWIVK